MSQVRVGRWGKNLALRVPKEIALATGLEDGEAVQIVAHDGDIIIRRVAAHTRAREAAAAAAEIVVESRRHSLGGTSIRDLLEEGRRK